MELDGHSRKESRNRFENEPNLFVKWKQVQLSATERKLLDSKASSTEWDCAQKAGGVPRCRVPRFVEACALRGEHTSDNEWQRVTMWLGDTFSEFWCSTKGFGWFGSNLRESYITSLASKVLSYKFCVNHCKCDGGRTKKAGGDRKTSSRGWREKVGSLQCFHCVHSNTMLWILPCDSNTEAIGRRAETPCRRRAAKCQAPATANRKHRKHWETWNMLEQTLCFMWLCQAKSCIQDIYLKTL